jgi:hypothetical protein
MPSGKLVSRLPSMTAGSNFAEDDENETIFIKQIYILA